MIDFKSRTILITGAGGGVGRAAAIEFAQLGGNLALTDIDDKSLQQTATLIQGVGAKFVAVAGDLLQRTTSAQLVKLAVDTFGGLDCVCNVAGICPTGPVESADRELFDYTLHINCFAPLMVVQSALPALRASRAPSIVNVASIGGLTALPAMSIYCASKAALIGLTRALAAELAPQVRCNAICPGGIDSPMSQRVLAAFTPEERAEALPKLTGRQLLKRFAEPAEIAATLVFLCSDAASFMTGCIMPVDAGVTAW